MHEQRRRELDHLMVFRSLCGTACEYLRHLGSFGRESSDCATGQARHHITLPDQLARDQRRALPFPLSVFGSGSGAPKMTAGSPLMLSITALA